jgi:thiol-disulfide isomerase/thioredoxin
MMTLIEFYGDGCPHCAAMEDKVERLQENEDVTVKQLEVWNDKENAERKKKLDDGTCGGVPFFFNTETEQWICGETSYMDLVAWAHGEEGE